MKWVAMLGITWSVPMAAQPANGVRGDPAAIAEAQAMVQALGGLAIWRDLEQLHFVHEWDLANRPDRYLEHEILDLSAPRSYVTMDSEVHRRVRAYSPEHRYWNVVDGTFSYATHADLANAMERSPFSLYRLARAVARGDTTYEIHHGPMPGLPGVTGLEFRRPGGTPQGWVMLNARHEPVVWTTTQYSYALGPLRRFGNLWVPDWGSTGGGRVRYQMVSLTGGREPPDSTLFIPPPPHR